MRNYLFFLKLLLKGEFKRLSLEFKLRGPTLYKKYVWEKYCNGFCEAAPESIESELVRQWYRAFIKNGYVVLEGHGDFCRILADGVKKDNSQDDFGREKTVLSNFGSRLFSETLPIEIQRLLAAIYGRSYWVRDKPFIMHHNGAQSKHHIQSAWHVDGFNQVTMQVLLEDSGKDPVSTELIVGSQMKSWSFNRAEIPAPSEGDRYKFHGKKGDLIIFNGGGCLHRSHVGVSGRTALFANFSSGWYEGILEW